MPMPMVCWRAFSEVATTLNVVGNDKALQARNRNAPSTSASHWIASPRCSTAWQNESECTFEQMPQTRSTSVIPCR